MLTRAWKTEPSIEVKGNKVIIKDTESGLVIQLKKSVGRMDHEKDWKIEGSSIIFYPVEEHAKGIYQSGLTPNSFVVNSIWGKIYQAIPYAYPAKVQEGNNFRCKRY